jgi:carboxymethylenebutenolidase
MVWNSLRTDEKAGMTAETIEIKGYNGDSINAYYAKPMGNGPFPGVVLVHHMPGWDELYREFARRFAEHGYATICPNLFQRFGHGSPDDMAAKARSEGGVPDASVVGDLKGAADYLRSQGSRKVGLMGTCSGGRHGHLAFGQTDAFDAFVNCWSGRVVQKPEDLNERQPVNPLDVTKDIKGPYLGIFGNDDQNPNPEMVNQLEEELKKQGKDYEFHRYDGAGHAFIYHDRPAYRQQQAMDAWGKIFEFFEKNLK